MRATGNRPRAHRPPAAADPKQCGRLPNRSFLEILRTENPLSAKVTNLKRKLIDSARLGQRKTASTWLVEQILVGMQPFVIGGPKKCLKTNLSIDLAISLGSGKSFLGKFPVGKPVPVAVMSGESGWAIIEETAEHVAPGEAGETDEM